jgi:diaminopimelate epimerase
MQFTFYKYQGTGNDFVMIDNRSLKFPSNDVKTIAKICDRRFGVGADGLILLENDPETDFKMVYYNADGNERSMCGNGGRCLVAFAKKMGVIHNKATFIAVDGLHHAFIDNHDIVSLQMKDVDKVQINNDYIFLNTGSPHHVQFENQLDDMDIKKEGAAIRYGSLYGKPGSNVNFVKQISQNEFTIRTYERGVEDETLSCGTGATAVAIAMDAIGKSSENTININVAGGKLEIAFQKEKDIYKNVFLKGPATFVFEGVYTINNF